MNRKNLTEAEILALLNARCKRSQQATVARELGVSPQVVCDIRKGRRPPSPSVAAGLGYRRLVRYEPIG